jgi:hypothetical protein
LIGATVVSNFGIRLLAVAVFLMGGCTNVPPFVFVSSGSNITPAGPKIASLMANLKCELWDAANDSTSELQAYRDSPDLRTNPAEATAPPDRKFTLKNYFQEIEYVADAEWTLDATGTGALNPLFIDTNPYKAAVGLFPMTSLVLTVSPQLSDTGHRFMQVYSSVDFARLVASEPRNYHYAKSVEPRISSYPCSLNYEPQGVELQGQLRLKETLATGITAISMNDVGLFPPDQPVPAGGSSAPASPENSLNSSGQYTFGIISAQIDFTIIEGISGGPTWTLHHFIGPGGSSQGFINLNRQVKDTLQITFVPVCIRKKYWSDPSILGAQHEYHPKFIVGTPGWANFLPPCNTSNYLDLQKSALAKARYTNYVNTPVRISAALLTSP